mgnify:CR=1 FL=1
MIKRDNKTNSTEHYIEEEEEENICDNKRIYMLKGTYYLLWLEAIVFLLFLMFW